MGYTSEHAIGRSLAATDDSTSSYGIQMASVTLKILHGADRGKLYEELEPPLALLEQMQDDVLQRLDELNTRVLTLLRQANHARTADENGGG